ncbi:hypothetical protein JCM8115_004298 [Rhodotorula mucilaginosa]|nr:hypothetical protein B0A53_05948 [Rhodotorula sp. CCFEE 5036]
MAIARAPPHSAERYHYARLLCTPISANTGAAQPSGTETATVIDRATVLQLFSRLLQDLYGTMGGPVALGELDVVAIEPARGGGQEQDDKASEVVIRFPAGATHAILTALPLATSSPFRLSVLRHSSDLSRLVGPAGHGSRGYAQWARGMKAMAVEKGQSIAQTEEVEMQHAA